MRPEIREYSYDRLMAGVLNAAAKVPAGTGCRGRSINTGTWSWPAIPRWSWETSRMPPYAPVCGDVSELRAMRRALQKRGAASHA